MLPIFLAVCRLLAFDELHAGSCEDDRAVPIDESATGCNRMHSISVAHHDVDRGEPFARVICNGTKAKLAAIQRDAVTVTGLLHHPPEHGGPAHGSLCWRARLQFGARDPQ